MLFRSNGLVERPENYAKLQQMLLARKNEQGTDEFPFIKHGMEHIDTAPEAFDSKTMLTTANSFLKLLSFPEGKKQLVSHFKESATENLGMLFDVIRRASTGSGKYTYEQVLAMDPVKFALVGFMEAQNIQDQYIPTEHRLDNICDNLQSFDIKAVWPVEDLLATDTAYGATIRRLLTRDNAQVSQQEIANGLPDEVRSHFELALRNNDNESLGVLFTKYSKYMGKILFPNAHSVDIRFEGERGHMSGSHLAPMKNSSPYLK